MAIFAIYGKETDSKMYLTTKIMQTERNGEDAATKFSGKRIHRGLYKSADGRVLNADINGSVNILRKHLISSKSNVVFTTDDVRVLVNAPCKRLSPFC